MRGSLVTCGDPYGRGYLEPKIRTSKSEKILSSNVPMTETTHPGYMEETDLPTAGFLSFVF